MFECGLVSQNSCELVFVTIKYSSTTQSNIFSAFVITYGTAHLQIIELSIETNWALTFCQMIMK
jgi:hypothetical protein